MTDLTSVEDLLLLLIAALLPAIVYLSWVRSSERYAREPWGFLLSSFFYGALFATIIAGLLEAVLLGAGTAFTKAYPAPEFTFLNNQSPWSAFFAALVLAPFVEEALKASGVTRSSARLRQVPDGLVVGAAVGLGFGFFETFLYGLGALATDGLAAGLGLIALRSISSVLLHGSTTAMFGYGYAESRFNGRTGFAGAYYLVAVGMHALFNALASLGPLATILGYSNAISDYASWIGLFLVILYAFAAIEHARSVIHRTEAAAAGGPPARYRPAPVKVARLGPTDRRR